MHDAESTDGETALEPDDAVYPQLANVGEPADMFSASENIQPRRPYVYELGRRGGRMFGDLRWAEQEVWSCPGGLVLDLSTSSSSWPVTAWS